ncbi:MAG: hypothetical protein EXR95_03600 [Gemmatimonadetes bacterium]|nr:hypothetical protein [Gemmatimonadota bacterium]
MHPNRTLSVALALAAAALVAGNASAQAQVMSPHIGHVNTSFRDTPEQKGFLETAIAEADVAIQHATLGMRDLTNLDMMKRHAGHVLNAVDPSLMAQGPGKGYGVKKAATNTAAHIEMAGGAADAPANVKTHSVHVATSAKNTVARADEIIALAQQIQAATTADQAKPLFEQLNAKTQLLRAGLDANSDGRVGWQAGEGGLDMSRTHMDLMMGSTEK